MTVDEIVTGLKSIQKHLEADDYAYDNLEKAIHLLRAGQDMSDAANSILGNYQPVSKSMHAAMIAWDAALKEDV